MFFQAERQGDRIVVQVRDQGAGIEPEMLEHMFDHFVQRPHPADRTQSGLGLGLTIARNLITLHGGTVRAQSDGAGRGTTIVVDLPAAAADPLPSVAPTSTQSSSHAVRPSSVSSSWMTTRMGGQH